MNRSGLTIAAAALVLGATATIAQSSSEADEPKAEGPIFTPAEFDENLKVGGEEIDARMLRSRMTVDVHINDQGPYRFVVDSGADTSVVGTKLAAKLGLPPAEPAYLHSMTESGMVDQVEVDELRLGPTATTSLDLPVLNEYDIGGDGMIGLDALVEQRLMMDFEKKVITVDESSKRAPMSGDVIVVTGRMQRGQLILTEVEAQRERVDAVIDTGTELTIGNSALRDALSLRRSAKIGKITIFGVTGKSHELDFIVLSRLKLGPVVLQNVPIAFADVPPFEVFGMSDKPALLLGTDLMENFRRVSLDFGERKVWFQLNRCSTKTIGIRTTQRASRISSDRDSACSL